VTVTLSHCHSKKTDNPKNAQIVCDKCQTVPSKKRAKKAKITYLTRDCHAVTLSHHKNKNMENAKIAYLTSENFRLSRCHIETTKISQIQKMQKTINSLTNKYFCNCDTVCHYTVWSIWWTFKRRTKARYEHILLSFSCCRDRNWTEDHFPDGNAFRIDSGGGERE
jgi:hypothetical protein